MDMENQGLQTSIYTLTQIMLMNWIKFCWRDVPSDAITTVKTALGTHGSFAVVRTLSNYAMTLMTN